MTVRGLTIIPAMAAALHEKAGDGPGIGSLEVGKAADVILFITGDPADPRSAVEPACWSPGREVRVRHRVPEQSTVLAALRWDSRTTPLPATSRRFDPDGVWPR